MRRLIASSSSLRRLAMRGVAGATSLTAARKQIKPPRVVILGGAGNTGIALGKLLLTHTQSEIVLAGRDVDKCRAVAAELNHSSESLGAQTCTGSDPQSPRVLAAVADASDASSLHRALDGSDLLVVAAPVTDHLKTVAECALDSGTDYLDVMVLPQRLQILKELEPRIVREGRVFVTEAGFHPGLISALIRWGAAHFSELRSANVFCLLNTPFPPSTSIYELFQLILRYNGRAFVDGAWRRFAASQCDFGPRFGIRKAYSMFMDELAPLPELVPSLRECGQYMATTSKMIDWVVFPLALLGHVLTGMRRTDGRFISWGMRRFLTPPFACGMQLEARGLLAAPPTEGESDSSSSSPPAAEEKLSLRVFHEDGYLITAAPVVAFLQQFFEKRPRPGLHFMGIECDAVRLVDDMASMGIEVERVTPV